MPDSKNSPFAYDQMNIFSTIASFYRLSVEEKEIFQNEISQENTRRVFFLSIIAIPVSLIHVVLFALKLKHVSGIEQQWVFSIIFSHITILIITTLCSVLLYFFFHRSKTHNLLSKIGTYIILCFLIVMGGIIASFDQYVTSAITPYFNTTLIISLFFLMKPLFSTIYFTASYLVFYFAMMQTQLNQDILISNQVNGLSITVIGLSLSFILWRSNLTRIKQRQQITRQNKALLESNAEKDKFFSIIAHDLKSPFNSILGFSDLLVHQVKEKDYDGIDQYAVIIQQSSKSAMDLLMNLMEWSKAHTGRMEFNPEYFELNELIKEAENLFIGAALQKKIKMSLHLPISTIVFADKNMIRTLLRNLISNAIKFTDSEGTILLSVVKNQNEVLVSVCDSGVGISKDAMKKLFRIDENYSTMGTQNEMGTGLGLILCKELIDKHAGKIWGESEYGKGSTFYLSLPC